MYEDQQAPVTLTIADCQTDLRVISFNGLDALNEPYRFNIKLVGSDPDLNLDSLLERGAFLGFGQVDHGIHGRISQASLIYTGEHLSLYHLVLMPTLEKLARRRQRRVYQDLTVPQLIVQLLEAHGIEADAQRFDHMTGLYPRRALCIQYDESDLHLLQRLCEEEGIHFRFEHDAERHILVFSDDPASFPLQRVPVRFGHAQQAGPYPPTLLHMAETLSMQSALRQHAEYLDEDDSPVFPARARQPESPAANQPFESMGNAGPRTHQQALHLQHGARKLERLRCERRDIRGRSNHTALRSGQILQVLDHPERLLNDQWLLTKVHHSVRQLRVLRGLNTHDILAILRILADEQSASIDAEQMPGNSYRNRFSVIPWATPFRPSLKRQRPALTGTHQATLMPPSDDCAQYPGYRPVGFDWQRASPYADSQPRWPRVQIACDTVYTLAPGARVLIRYLDNNADRPVICAALLRPEDAARPCITLDGAQVTTTRDLPLENDQRLNIASSETITLHGRQADIHIDTQGVTIIGAAFTTMSSGPLNNP
ncbi:type VI secretion system Vgr family protein [Pseudomonas syringae]|uniref:Type VI secretion system tip protein VgrG n=2 Tax=Pseudomonas syringae TaxID=317 RepID=A0A9Q4A6E3_PSESX|nr:type VI secretion system tip protein TssI/VgrG [Pseudomonas syringae]MCF5466825.1 type VI secretion system tip protein VgrG [Pseudomonas syringae]MCF5471707.1 type VI secretion system tip protein VgrG [Pseudomonas syringae]MCF5482684.1 type VI secretion system tip protein VgrG [Pseudomonas syringae]MCF5489040.1 type VI secretion system tip protein VgrG [Pseudomonas syringae]MCF5491972.1 type VI secretion system tip protein VgrG [Pseudomonas syringae]